MNRNINKIAKKVVTVLVVIILLGGGIGLVALMGIIDSDSGQENIGAEKIGGDLCYALRIPALGYEEFNQVPLAQQPSLQLPPDWSVVGFTATQPQSPPTIMTALQQIGPKLVAISVMH